MMSEETALQRKERLHKRLSKMYHTRKFKATVVVILMILTLVLRGERVSLVLFASRAIDFIAGVIEYGIGFEEGETKA